MKYWEYETKLMGRKTIWGLLFLSFSPSWNLKRLFQLTIIQKWDIVIQICEGMQAILLLWIIMGNTFMFSFLSYPINFDSWFELLQNFLFLSIFNTDSAYDGLVFLNAILLSYQIWQLKENIVWWDVFIMIVHQIIKTAIPVAFSLLIATSTFLYLGSGPLWLY